MRPGPTSVDPPGRAPARRSAVLAGLALLVSTAAGLAAVELGMRLWRGRLAELPDPMRHVGLAAYPAEYDATIGHVPTRGFAGRDNPWGVRVTITSDGVRSNGAGAPPAGSPILAVGDSFTFGDEVDDPATWPAALERILRRPVVNGGVFGYGFDQIVLRAEALLAHVPARLLVVSLIPDDVKRCEYAYRYAWKPYFEPADGELALRNVPVPPPSVPPRGRGALAQALAPVLRVSVLADFFLRRLEPPGWPVHGIVRAHRHGAAVALGLVDRLAALAARRELALLLVVQWHPGALTDLSAPVVDRARARGLEVLEIAPLLAAQSADDLSAFFSRQPADRGRARPGHMTASGNEWLAGVVARRLAQASLGTRHP